MFTGCYWPTRAHWQHECICVMGQSENFLGSHLNKLWAMRHSWAETHVVCDGPTRANCKKPMAHEWAHASTCTYDLSRCRWPTRAHQQHESICVMGQSNNLLGSHLNNPCRSMQHSHTAAHIMLDGPMCDNCRKTKGG